MRAKEKKAAISAYKKRKVVAGIYLIRCAASGETWIEAFPNLSPEDIRAALAYAAREFDHPVIAAQ